MECNSCLSNEYIIKDDFSFECKYCLNEIENLSFRNFLEEFKSAYVKEENLSSIINQYFDDIKHLSFPFLIRDYVQSDYNYSVIANEIRKLPIYEINIILDITGSNTKVGFSYTRSSEIIDQIVLYQDQLPDLLIRLELLAITLATEQGSFPYTSMEDLGYIYMDPKGQEIVQAYKRELKKLGNKVLKAGVDILDFLEKKSKTQQKYFEECTAASKFITKPYENGLIITQCSDKSKVLRIPPSIHGEIVRAIGEKAFVSNKASVIEVPFTIREISPNAFIDQQSLTHLKCGNQTPLRGDMFVNCPVLQRVELTSSHRYKEIEGVIYSKNDNDLVYFPSALAKDTIIIDRPMTLKEGSLSQAKYLRTVDFLNDSIIIERNAFKLDESSPLSPDSVKKVLEHMGSQKQESHSKYDPVEDNKATNNETSHLDQTTRENFDAHFNQALQEDHISDKKNYLVQAIEVAVNYIEKAKAFDELLKFEEGLFYILQLEFEEPYLLYYPAMAKVKTSSDDQEKILQLFLDAYHAGNSRAGVNASTMLKNGKSGLIDLSMAERILVDLSEKNNLDGMLKLVLFYNEHPQLCTRDISPLIETLKSKHYDEFSAIYADLLYKGNIIPQDIDQSIDIMKSLSERGNKNASYQLGFIYMSDETHKNLEEAKRFLNKAHLQGHKDAKRAILKIQEKEGE